MKKRKKLSEVKKKISNLVSKIIIIKYILEIFIII